MNAFENKKKNKFNYLLNYVVEAVYKNEDFDLYSIDDDNCDYIYELDMFLSIYRKEIIKLKNNGVSLMFAVDDIKEMIEEKELYNKELESSLKRFLLYEGMSLDTYVKSLYLDDYGSDDLEDVYYEILSLYGKVLADEFIKIKDKYFKLYKSRDKVLVMKKR